MKISKLRTLAVFGVVKDALTPAEYDRYQAHKRAYGKHFFQRMHRGFQFGAKQRTRRALWRALQDRFSGRTTNAQS
jgi:hypothetical protein